MSSKSGTFSLLWTDGKEDRLTGDKIFVLVMALLGLVAAVAIVYLGAPLANPEAYPANVAGTGVDSSYWSALGEFYAPDYEASASASAARWTALGRTFGDASTARWEALGELYVPDYEASASASAARWTALGRTFGDASTARWEALGEFYAPDYEASASASAARWTALGCSDSVSSQFGASKAAQATDPTDACTRNGPCDS